MVRLRIPCFLRAGSCWRLVTLRLVSHTSGAGSAILLYEGLHTWPDQLQGLGYPKVTQEDVIMLVLKDAKSKILSLGNISLVIEV
jgi:hypothetical protein